MPKSHTIGNNTFFLNANKPESTFYIESINETTLVIHGDHYKHYLFKTQIL